MKKETSFFVVGTIVLLAGVIVFVVFFGDTAMTIISSLATLIGIIALLVEFGKGRDLRQSEFLVNTNDFFMKKASNVRIAGMLNRFIETGVNKFTKKDQSDLIDYLVFFESLAPSITHGLVSLKKIDDMLSYSFFRIMNNKFVQDMEIIPEAEYYRGCIKVHKMWTRYKIKHNLPILLEETSLEKRLPEYEKFAKD